MHRWQQNENCNKSSKLCESFYMTGVFEGLNTVRATIIRAKTDKWQFRDQRWLVCRTPGVRKMHRSVSKRIHSFEAKKPYFSGIFFAEAFCNFVFFSLLFIIHFSWSSVLLAINLHFIYFRVINLEITDVLLLIWLPGGNRL